MFIWEKLPLGVTSMIVCVGLVITGVLDWKTAFSGFIDSNVILFVAMFIVGGALFETGMANKIGGVVTHFAKSEKQLIIAIMVSVYMISDHKNIFYNFKRVLYAVFPKNAADTTRKICRESGTIFLKFMYGKALDSLIIGIICFICMTIFKFPYTVLISVIVGITNMIPYFGPFLGGIPSILLLCIYSLNSALIFAILIIIIQQLDGNLIGPKILGNSTGLRPLWIIFAITLGGWIAGIPGMLLGVPCVAVIAGLLEDWVNERLEAKNIDMPIVKNEKVREAKEEMKEKEESK